MAGAAAAVALVRTRSSRRLASKRYTEPVALSSTASAGFPTGPCGLPRTTSGSDFDLLRAPYSVQAATYGTGKDLARPREADFSKERKLLSVDPLDSYSVSTDGIRSSREIELLVPPSGVSSRLSRTPNKESNNNMSQDVLPRARSQRRQSRSALEQRDIITPVPDPGARPPGRARRPRRAGEGADRARARPSPSGCRSSSGTRPPTASRPRSSSCPTRELAPAGRRRARADRPSRRSLRVAAVYGGAPISTPVQARPRRAHPRRHAGPAAGSDRAPARPARPRPRRSSSTRPTGCSTWASSRRSTASSGALPAKRQTMLFSATLDGEVGELARAYTSNPSRFEAQLPEGRTQGEVEHTFVSVTRDGKLDRLIEELEDDRGLALVFVRTKRGADRLAAEAPRARRPAARAARRHVAGPARAGARAGSAPAR